MAYAQGAATALGVSPEERMGHVAAVVGGTLVAHGGRTSPDRALSNVWACHLGANPHGTLAWQALSPLVLEPAARHRHSAITGRLSEQVRRSDAIYAAVL
jgi:hypothetical protein